MFATYETISMLLTIISLYFSNDESTNQIGPTIKEEQDNKNEISEELKKINQPKE
ncbi:hypothetical protein ACKP2L_04950 [Oenococcus alcoholitolerans]|uniref:hypothetical protein n=1 Tax=Oenococcus alcoholitolerans TaxID=931074 RepID=UPI003F6F1BDE